MASRGLIGLVLVFVVTGFVQAGYEDWPCYGHTPTRHSIAVDGPDAIDANTLAWVADEDPQDPNYYVEFEGATGPVLYEGIVYAYARYYDEFGEYTDSQIVAYDADSGEILWATVIDKAAWDSWASPCIDAKHNKVLIGSGNKVFALDAQSGVQNWVAQLEKDVINASACVAGDIPYARAFITDFDGYGSSGKLYCINLDSNEPNNPYEPGDIVWSEIIGNTSGNTPAYSNGVVYIASIGGTSGSIHAYDATAEPNAIKLWETTDPNFDGFFGGVTITKEGFLYAASYDYTDANEDNSALCKLDCDDGRIIWITQTERTDSMPVVVGDKIYISGGIADDPPWVEGSRPKVEAYQDYGESVTKLWETPASMVMGGWANQPVYANGKLYVGAIPLSGNYYGSYTELYILDVSLAPDDPNFIIAHYQDKECGNNPVVTCDSVYTIGYDGLFKFHQAALLGDVSKDNKVDMYDLAFLVDVWLYDGLVGVSRPDLDLDGDVDFIDFSLMTNQWDRGLD